MIEREREKGEEGEEEEQGGGGGRKSDHKLG